MNHATHSSSWMGPLDPARRSFPSLFCGEIAGIINAGYFTAAPYVFHDRAAATPTFGQTH
jgi:hypothetical protein